VSVRSITVRPTIRQLHTVEAGVFAVLTLMESSSYQTQVAQQQNVSSVMLSADTHTHTRLKALFRDYPGEPVPER